ncbi:MAG: binding-protein-dependent transport system inner membrane [Geobacteraceae bacterium]|nr:MAG: binding-protein-dependent transport system inner membrane [Geobacteraceae bacterium]
MSTKAISLTQLQEKVRTITLPLIVLLVWWVVSHREIVSPHFLPRPETVVGAFFTLVEEGILSFNLKMSFTRVISGFLLGISFGLVLGIAMGLSRTVEKLLRPLFDAVRQVPMLGFIPLIILWCGVNETSKVVFIAIGAYYSVVLNTFEGIRSVKKEYLEVAQVFEFGRFNLLRKFVLPAALPSILTGLRLGLSKSWMLVVGAELFTATKGGIGSMMAEGREQWRMEIVFVGIIIVGLVGFVLDQLLKVLEGRLLRWRKAID